MVGEREDVDFILPPAGSESGKREKDEGMHLSKEEGERAEVSPTAFSHSRSLPLSLSLSLSLFLFLPLTFLSVLSAKLLSSSSPVSKASGAHSVRQRTFPLEEGL